MFTKMTFILPVRCMVLWHIHNVCAAVPAGSWFIIAAELLWQVNPSSGTHFL